MKCATTENNATDRSPQTQQSPTIPPHPKFLLSSNFASSQRRTTIEVTLNVHLA